MLVVHPLKVVDIDALEELARRRCVDLGWPHPLIVETTTDDAGTGLARAALAQGAQIVVAAGGDGTVRAVAEALTGTDAVLGVVPLGTGNLLARNLGIPTALDEAVEVALTGRRLVIDVGRVQPGGEVFTVMAGMGLDAAMVRDAPEGVKKRIGWLAYVISALRALREDRMRVTVQVDDRPPLRRSARAVLVGNVGELQGGIDLLPESDAADGALHVAILAPRGPLQWVSVLLKSASGSHPSRRDRRLERFTGRRLVVRATVPQAREADGDVLDDDTRLEVEIVPAALAVHVPANAG